MTEEEYGTCHDIMQLEIAARATRTVSARRGRLFAHACALRVRHLLTRPALRQAVVTAGHFADGGATAEELREAWLAARTAMNRAPLHSKWQEALSVLLNATTSSENGLNFRWTVLSCCRTVDLDERGEPSFDESSEAYRREMARCCELFRDLFPYHAPYQPASPPPWAGGEAGHVARTVYEEGRFEDLPILADALEDAGCDRPELIAHCREPGPHIRGCWAVDLVLGLS